MCELFKRKCLNGTAECDLGFEEEAAKEGLFFLSLSTAAGDEIGWDFIMRVRRTRTSFTAFVNEMTRQYNTTHPLCRSFMSTNTFIKWFFAWMASMKLDFRAHVDPYCRYNPKVLACDGTHIGVSVKHQRLHPVTTPDLPEITKKPLHKRFVLRTILVELLVPKNLFLLVKLCGCAHFCFMTFKFFFFRYDRVLIKDTHARAQLRYLSCRALNKPLKPDEKLQTGQELDRKNQVMLAEVDKLGSQSLFDIIELFAAGYFAGPMGHTIAKLMHLLSSDAAILSVVPFQSHDVIREICNLITSGDPVPSTLMYQMKKFSKELADLFLLAGEYDIHTMICEFVLYLVQRVVSTHAQDAAPAPPAPIPGSYNPESGVAYYFTRSGCQLRKTPKYKVNDGDGDKKKKKKKKKQQDNFDDAPLVDEACRKNYPKVSFGGYGYMFIFFCPIHGHCYGLHLIAGGEGRKDPFSALYKYMEEPPTDVFYDFACQLSEYTLNREPGFFCCTRFWHDLFHGVTHKCAGNFKSQRVCGLDGINSEICEQWNSLLQCIKYTASHLSQAHMMFFAQFFIFMFNQEKTKRFEKLVNIAYQGTLS